MRSIRIFIYSVLCCIVTSGVSAAEFRINSTTSGNQGLQSIGSNGSNYFAMWQLDDVSTSLYMQMLDIDGTFIGSEQQIASFAYTSHYAGSVSSDGTDYFLVYSDADASGSDANGTVGEIYGRVVSGDGSSIGSQFQVNTTTSNIQVYTQGASNGSSYLAVWGDYSANVWQTKAQLYQTDGTPITVPGEIAVNPYGVGDNPRVGANNDSYLVGYFTYNGQYNTQVRLIQEDGTMSAQQQLNTTSGNNMITSITSDGNRFLALFSYNGVDIYGRFVDSTGTPEGSQFKVDSYDVGSQYQATSAYNGEAYLASWISSGQDGDGTGVYGQLIAQDGTFIGSEFRLNTYTSGDQSNVQIASAGDDFFITWQSDTQDGSTDVFGIIMDADDPYIFGYITDAAADFAYGEDWDLSDMNDLYALFKDGEGTALIDGETWYFSDIDSNTTYQIGAYWNDGQYKYMYLADGYLGLSTNPLSVHQTPIPEPSTAGLLLTALPGLCAVLRLRNRIK